jgi:hypothetical protein
LAKAMEGYPCVFDLEVTLGCRSRRSVGSNWGSSLFTLVSHGKIWHEQLQRPMTLEEWLGAHLIPTWNNPPGHHWNGPHHADSLPVPCDYMKLVNTGQVLPSTLKSAVGNGWHIGILTSWIMFVMASVEFGQNYVRLVQNPCPQTPPAKRRKQWASPPQDNAENDLGDAPSTEAPQQTSSGSPHTQLDSPSRSTASPWLQGTTTALFFKELIEIDD